MMTRFVLAVAALVFAGPGFAQTPLERSLGVPAGLYTSAELVQMKFAADGIGLSRPVDTDRTPGRIIFSTTGKGTGSESEIVLQRTAPRG